VVCRSALVSSNHMMNRTQSHGGHDGKERDRQKIGHSHYVKTLSVPVRERR
jgi:hypothetical protein